jgi:hypothetical protein
MRIFWLAGQGRDVYGCHVAGCSVQNGGQRPYGIDEDQRAAGPREDVWKLLHNAGAKTAGIVFITVIRYLKSHGQD